MTPKILVSTPTGSWEVVPANMLAGTALALICIYILFRAILWMITMTDVYGGVGMKSILFPKRSGWRPDKSRLNRSTLHLILSGILLVVFFDISDYFGWLLFIEQ